MRGENPYTLIGQRDETIERLRARILELEAAISRHRESRLALGEADTDDMALWEVLE